MAKRIRSSTTSLSSESMDKHFKRSDYSPYSSRRASKNSNVWENYLRRSDGLMALCKLCEEVEPLPKLIPTKDYNTTGLVNHLISKHQISVIKPNSVKVGDQPGAPAINQVVNKKSSVKDRMTDYFQPSVTMDSLIAELVAKDGVSFRTIANSKALRRLFNSEFGKLPRSHVTVRRRFMKYGNSIKSEKKKAIRSYLNSGGKYSITLDEWTSGNNRRYLNVNIHDTNHNFINLGLEAIPERFSSQDCLQLVEKRLQSFGLDLYSDIVGSTNDGANVMKKYGSLSKIINQLCFAHGMHLAVVDSLYTVKKESPNSGEVLIESDNDSEWEDLPDDESADNNELPSTESSTEESESESEEDHNFTLPNSGQLEMQESVTKRALEKIRATSKLFRKSVPKNNLLQKQISKDRDEIEQKTGRKLKGRLNLLLDTRIRWSSLLPMAQRYMDIRSSVEKALIDLKPSLTKAQKQKITSLTDEEVEAINNLLEVLGPLKTATEEICASDVNLLSFEEIYSVLLTELQKNNTEFGQKLIQNILDRIDQRRTDWSRVLYTLHTPEESSDSESDSEESRIRISVPLNRRRCWNCGSFNHQIEDCLHEKKPENIKQWRRVFERENDREFMRRQLKDDEFWRRTRESPLDEFTRYQCELARIRKESKSLPPYFEDMEGYETDSETLVGDDSCADDSDTDTLIGDEEKPDFGESLQDSSKAPDKSVSDLDQEETRKESTKSQIANSFAGQEKE